MSVTLAKRISNELKTEDWFRAMYNEAYGETASCSVGDFGHLIDWVVDSYATIRSFYIVDSFNSELAWSELRSKLTHNITQLNT